MEPQFNTRKKFDAKNLPKNLRKESGDGDMKKENNNSPKENIDKKSNEIVDDKIENQKEEINYDEDVNLTKDSEPIKEKNDKENNNDQRDKNDNKEKKQDELLISKIESVYALIKENEPYFSKLPWIMMILVAINSYIVCLIVYMMKHPVNNVYCWNKFSLSFEICNIDYACYMNNKGQNIDLFLSKSYNMSNIDSLVELEAINNKFAFYFMLEQKLYVSNNFNEDYSGNNVADFFNGKIFIDTFERWSVLNLFRLPCKFFHETTILQVFIAFGTLLTPIIYGVLADSYGRKFVIAISLIIQIIGLLGCFLYIFLIINVESKYITNNNENMTDLMNNQLFKNFRKKYYTNSVFNKDYYELSFKEINNIYFSQNELRDSHNKYKFFMYICLSLIVSSIINIPIGLSLTLEFALNDSHFFDLYSIYNYGYPVSIFFLVLSITFIEEIHWIFLTLAIIEIIYLCVLLLKIEESPRLLFEFRSYKKIRDIFGRIVTSISFLKDNEEKYTINPLTNFIINTPEKVKLFKLEIKNFNDLNEDSIWKTYSSKGCCAFLNRKLEHIKANIKKKGYMVFKPSEFFVNPIVVYTLMFNTGNLKTNFKVILSISMIISFIFYLSFFNLFSYDFITKNDLYTKYFYNHSLSFSCILMYVSFTIFNFIIKFFDYTYVLLVNFVGVFIFSLILGLNSMAVPTYSDLNTEYFGSMYSEVLSQGDFNVSMKMLVFFFSSGLFYCVYCILIKSTKTIFRCSFLCLEYFFLTLMMFLAYIVFLNFSKNMFYLTVMSILGFVTLYFLTNANELNLITDFTSLEISSEDQ